MRSADRSARLRRFAAEPARRTRHATIREPWEDARIEFHNLQRCTFEVNDESRRAKTVFDDGSELVAVPMMDAENIARARSLGYAGSDEEAVWKMTRHHDLVHTLLAEAEGFPYSLTLHAVANGYELPPGMSQREERIVFLIQRLLNVGIAGVLSDV